MLFYLLLFNQWLKYFHAYFICFFRVKMWSLFKDFILSFKTVSWSQTHLPQQSLSLPQITDLGGGAQ